MKKRIIKMENITQQEFTRILFSGDIVVSHGDLIQVKLVDFDGEYTSTVTYQFDANWDTPDYLRYRIVPEDSESSLVRIESIY